MKFEVERGADDSATAEKLRFTVFSAEIDESNIYFELAFDNPLEVSIGATKDLLMITIVNEAFFSNMKNGKTIPAGTTKRLSLPKMFSNENL